MSKIIRCDKCEDEFKLDKSSWNKIKTIVIHSYPLKKKNSKVKIRHICVKCIKKWGLK